MLYTDVDTIRSLMNEYGKNHEPFLFVLNFEMTEGYFVPQPLNQSELLFQVNGTSNKPDKECAAAKGKLPAYPVSEEEYKRKFDTVYKGLHRGDSFLTNLTVKTPIETSLSLSDIFLLSNSPYQLYIPERFVCFSPERFVKIRNGRISTHPMKGTIDAAIENAVEKILNDFKETAEHNTIVDLLRNDLSIVAEKVRVKRFRYIDEISTNNKKILQVSSEIEGELPEDYNSRLGDIIFRMLPAGSVSGAPKVSTVNIIRNAEKENRGYYTGIFGYYDGETLDSAVLIRFIEETGGKKYFRSGGGITVYSDWKDEYKEVLDKIYLPFV